MKLFITTFVWKVSEEKFQPRLNFNIVFERKRRRSDPDLWKKPLYQQKIWKPMDNTNTPSKTSITQRLRTDLGRSVGVTTVIQLVWLNRLFMLNMVGLKNGFAKIEHVFIYSLSEYSIWLIPKKKMEKFHYIFFNIRSKTYMVKY